MPTLDPAYSFLGYEQITGLSAVKGFASIPDRARFALITAEAQNVRYREDGNVTAPTAAIGQRIIKDQPPFVFAGNLQNVRFIEEVASAKLNVTYAC